VLQCWHVPGGCCTKRIALFWSRQELCCSIALQAPGCAGARMCRCQEATRIADRLACCLRELASAFAAVHGSSALLQVLGGSGEYAEQLGALLWPQLAAAYIAAKLKPIAPQSDAEVRLWLCGKLVVKWSPLGWVVDLIKKRAEGATLGAAHTGCPVVGQRSSPAFKRDHCVNRPLCRRGLHLVKNMHHPDRHLQLIECCVQVEGYSRRSSLGAKLEQKAVKLHLLSGGC